MTKALQEQQIAFNLAGQAANIFGSALANIEDPAAKVAGLVAQAIGSIALAYGQALAADPTMKTSVYGLIAGSVAAMVSMTTAIAQVHSATGYAEGGIVQGNSYSGDNVGPAMLNSGELVLNKAQQGVLASQLQGGGLQNLKLDGVVTGENIHIVHNRYLKRSGQGELVTW